VEASLEINTKLPKVGDSIFSKMTEAAIQEDALNLAQGFPDFDPDSRLKRAVSKSMTAGYNQYAPMAGYLPLRESIAAKIEMIHGASYHPETEITITPGATSAIYTAITSVIREEDEVIILEPVYDCYAPAIELNGGRPIRVELEYPNYSINWEDVKKVISYRTKMIIINSPHNPTGAILKEEDIAELTKLVNNTDILILSDEVYEHIVFDEKEHLSIAKYPDLASRAFVVSSFGKSYHCTGWKMGYVVAPQSLTSAFRKVFQFNQFSVATPFQVGFNEILQHRDLYFGLASFYEEKRNLFASAVEASRFKIMSCEGSYFQLLDYSAITDEKDVDFAMRMTKEFKLASIPVSVFYRSGVDHQVLRFCFAKSEKVLKQAGDILCKI
jgi:methionine aminotransferase